MTLTSPTVKVTYNGDGSTVNFSTVFIFWQNTDVRVIHLDSLGVETVWVEGTQYDLTGGSGAAGTVTVKTSPTDYTPASGEKLFIKSNRAETQPDDLPLSGSLPSTVVEQMADKTVRMVQQHSEQISRTALLPETTGLSDLELPPPGAGELLRYNAGGTNLETVALSDLSIATANAILGGLATNDFLTWDNAQSAWINITPSQARTDLGFSTYSFTDTSNTAITTTVPTGTLLSSSQSMEIPTSGMILFFTTIRISNSSGTTWDYYVGLRINGTDYWPYKSSGGPVTYTQIVNNVANGNWESSNDAKSGASFAPTLQHLDIDAHGISTGTQTVQPVIASENGTPTSEQMDGATLTFRMKVMMVGV